MAPLTLVAHYFTCTISLYVTRPPNPTVELLLIFKIHWLARRNGRNHSDCFLQWVVNRNTLQKCLLQTPPLTTALIHPSKLHRFLFSPWVLQTPPLRHGCYNPRSCIVSSPWVSYNFLSFGLLDIHFSAVRPTNPSLLDFIGTSLMAASFTVTFAPWVIHTPPSLALVGTPFEAVHRFLWAPCVLQTPPFRTLIGVHYSKLHRDFGSP